jgi:hypothetical protein
MHLILGKISLIKRTMRVRDARMCVRARVCVCACVRVCAGGRVCAYVRPHPLKFIRSYKKIGLDLVFG